MKISMPSVLKYARKTGYTQGQLADAAGFPQPLILRIERGDVNPRSSALQSLFDHLEPATTSPDTKLSTSPTTGFSLLEKIEWELESVQNPPDRFESTNDYHRDAKEYCPECNSDLTSYRGPGYCPDCGTKI